MARFWVRRRPPDASVDRAFEISRRIVAGIYTRHICRPSSADLEQADDRLTPRFSVAMPPPCPRRTQLCRHAPRLTPAGNREARTIAFLKRFVVFNLDQIEGLPERFVTEPGVPDPVMQIAEVDRLIAASGADFRIGGDEAFYSPTQEYVQVPPQAAYHEPINWFRTALHEMVTGPAVRQE